MKKFAKASALVLFAGLAAGCATTSDIENLQSQIDDLKSQVSKASRDASDALSAANAANSAASEAAAAANRAAQYAQDTNAKLDNMFKKAMMK